MNGGSFFKISLIQYKCRQLILVLIGLFAWVANQNKIIWFLMRSLATCRNPFVGGLGTSDRCLVLSTIYTLLLQIDKSLSLPPHPPITNIYFQQKKCNKKIVSSSKFIVFGKQSRVFKVFFSRLYNIFLCLAMEKRG